MSEPRLISPILDGFAIGGAMSDHHGVRCYPAMKDTSDDRYIVKVISIPPSQTQLDALLLTGVYADEEAAQVYFKELTDEVLGEVDILSRLAELDGFLAFESCQTAEMEDGTGYEVYLLNPYRRTLERHFHKNPLTHLGAVNLGLDLCSALTSCRRSGYLYVALKPSNVFITPEQEFRIGDLGFMRLDSLKYASLPEKYRSAYTPPEIADAYASLNTTMDTYAVGLILYQVYNNGELPVAETPDAPFPAPQYADYEMAEIILKACDPDPEKRWEDPAQLGQALVNYMQRNGVNDTPIVPPAPAIIEEEPAVEEETAEPDTTEEQIQEATEEISVEEPQVEEIAAEEDFENLSFLTEEDELDIEASDVSYDEVSSEVTEILEQVDDLAEHPVPAPAIAPDPIEVTLPEPEPEPEEEIAEEPEDSEESETSEEENSSEETPEEAEDIPESDEETEEDYEEDYSPNPKKRKKLWIWLGVVAGVVLLLAVAAFFFIKHYYLVPIKDITLSGDKDTLTVQVDTHIDESILLVVCTDSHGNQFSAPVQDGQAVITGLNPDTGYSVKVVVSGFRKVTGESSTAYSTPAQTNVIQFNAVMGAEEGSVILAFNIDGPDSDQWNIRYSAEGVEPVTVSFPSHMFTLNDLTLGKEYTFTLSPASSLYMTGTSEIKFTPSKLVYPENLQIISCIDNSLTAKWNENADVASWTVRCYNEDSSYDKTIVVETNTATFEELDHTDSFTVEVTAANMSVGQRAYAEKNAINLSNLKIDESNPNRLTLTWDSTQNSGEGWLISTSIDGFAAQVVPATGNSAVISPIVPGAKHTISIKDAKGVQVLGGIVEYTAKAASDFSGYNVSASDMKFSMCKTPSYSNWNRYYLSSSDYTTTFKAGTKASFVVKLNKSYNSSKDTIVTLFAIYDESGKLVSAAAKSRSWNSMWSYGYCEMDIPAMPDTAGKYTVSVFFNGALAGKQDFTIS